jgi:choline-sulfatase
VSYVSPHFPLRAPQRFYDLYQNLNVPWPYHYAEAERSDHPAIKNLMEIWNYDDFFDEATVIKARRAYYGLISYLDYNVGLVRKAAAELSGQDNTVVILTSDHGEMLGNKGIWSTSAMYEESAGVPLIAAGPGFSQGKVVETLTSHVDLAPTLLTAAGAPLIASEWRGKALQDIASLPTDQGRVIFSEYHAGGSNTAFFMICKGRYKYIVYVGYTPELFDLIDDPHEGHNLAANPEFSHVVRELDSELRRIVDPEAVNRNAFATQSATIEKHGGRDAVRRRGHPGEHSLDRHLGYE